MTVATARPEVQRETAAILTNLIDRLQEIDIFEGLDERTVNRLRAKLAQQNDPDLRRALVDAAQYRKAHQRKARVSSDKRSVYFVRAQVSGLIKIGSAAHPEGRLRTLQTGSPEPLQLLATSPGGERHERELHTLLSGSRSHGEWFHPTADVLACIRDAVS